MLKYIAQVLCFVGSGCGIAFAKALAVEMVGQIVMCACLVAGLLLVVVDVVEEASVVVESDQCKKAF